MDRIETLQGCLDNLRKHLFELPVSEATVAPEVFHGLHAALEQLEVAEAELRRQNEALTRAHASLEEERNRYRELFNFAPDGYLVTDSEGVIQDANRAAAKLLNIAQHSLAGKPLVLYVAEPERRQLLPLSQQEWEVTLQPHERAPFPAALTAASISNDHGEQIGLRWLIRDISARKEVERALHHSEDKFRSLVEQSSDWIWEIDGEGRFGYVSPQARDITGYESGELLGKTSLDFMTAAEAERFSGAFEAYASTQAPFSQLEKTIVHKDGHEIILDTSGLPIFDEAGRYRGYRGIARDVTERRRMERALQASKQKTLDILESITDAFVALDRDWCFLYVNQEAARLLKVSQEELIGHTLWDKYPEAKTLTIYRQAEQIMNGTTKRQLEEFYAPLNLWIEGHIYPSEAGLSVYLRDISERKRTEAELASMRHRLAHIREEERSLLARELHDGAVQQLLGISYLVAEGKRRAAGSGEAGDEAVQGTLEHVHKELLEVVKQLRGVIGELRPAALEELGLRVALEGLAAQLTRTAGESGASGPEIALDIHLEDDLPRPVARCVFRVAQEALRNALRYARASRITLRLRSAAGLTLTVTDDGSGFCVPQHLSELAKEDHFGLVGMAEQVASVSGELSIRSQPGKGTEVAVAIPIPKGPATEGPVTEDPISEQRMTAGQGVKPRG